MRRIAAFLVVLMALVACGSDSPRSGTVSEPPAGYVATPHGLMHRSCVGVIAPGDRISADGVVTRAHGDRQPLARCRYPRLNARTFEPIVPGRGVSPTTSGWIEASNWTASSALGYLSARFSVPLTPTSPGGTIFFFPGAEPDDGSTILQPVLQYGTSAGGGGDYWTAGSWFCCPAGWSFYSSLINVNAGDTILGTMTATCSDSSCNWSIATSNTTLGTSTTLAADDVTSSFTSIYGGVLESYAVSDCTQYPATGTITFTDIVLRDQAGNSMQPDWSSFVNSGDPMCPYAVQTSARTTTLTY